MDRERKINEGIREEKESKWRIEMRRERGNVEECEKWRNGEGRGRRERRKRGRGGEERGQGERRRESKEEEEKMRK